MNRKTIMPSEGSYIEKINAVIFHLYELLKGEIVIYHNRKRFIGLLGLRGRQNKCIQRCMRGYGSKMEMSVTTGIVVLWLGIIF